MARPQRPGNSLGLPFSLQRVFKLSQGINSVADAVRNVTGFFAAIGSTFFAIFGTGVSTGALSLPSLPLADAAFPIRFGLFIVVSAGLGWALGSLLGLTGRLPRELRPILAILLAVLFAGLIAGTADWLVSERGTRTAIPQGLVMTLIGAGIALRASAYQYEVNQNRGDRVAILRRANAMLGFALATTVIIALSEMGVA